MSDLNLDAIRERAGRYGAAIGPGGEKAWLAHQVASDVPALLAEVERLRGQLAAAEELLLGAVENGPWVLIEDPRLRQVVGEYVADTCHSVAAAAGLDEAMEYAHSRMPTRLARSLPAKAAELDAHGGAR